MFHFIHNEAYLIVTWSASTVLSSVIFHIYIKQHSAVVNRGIQGWLPVTWWIFIAKRGNL